MVYNLSLGKCINAIVFVSQIYMLLKMILIHIETSNNKSILINYVYNNRGTAIFDKN